MEDDYEYDIEGDDYDHLHLLGYGPVTRTAVYCIRLLAWLATNLRTGLLYMHWRWRQLF